MAVLIYLVKYMKLSQFVVLVVGFFLIVPVQKMKAQCANLSLNIADTVCIAEATNIVNNTVVPYDYEWDFCPNSLVNSILDISTNSIGISDPFGIEYVADGLDSYVFILHRSSNKLVKAKFIGGLGNTPIITDLGNIDSKFAGSQGISIYNEAGNWYGLVTNRDGSKEVILIDFGSSLDNDSPTASVSYTAGVDHMRSIEVVEQSGDIYSIIVGGGNSGQLLVLKYGSSITNTPSLLSNSIDTGNFPSGLSIYRECSNWYGLVSSDLSNVIYKINFGTDLESTPVSDQITGVSQPRSLTLNKDLEEFYGHVYSNNGDRLYRIDFGADFEDNQYSIVDVGGVGATNIVASYKIVKEGSLFYSIAVGRNELDLVIKVFNENCSVNDSFSTDVEPTGIEFSNSGWKYLDIKYTDVNGLAANALDSVYVRAVPVSDYSSSKNCTSIGTDFQDLSIGNGISIISWSWNFDDPSSGDNISNLQNPTHSFALPGDYNVTLQITDQCGQMNTLIKSVKIYDTNDLQADFSFPALICSNTSIDFIDESMASEDIPTSYSWNFDGLGSSTLKNPQFTFSSGGDYDIGLTVTGLSGCEKNVAKTIIVIEGAIPSYTYDTGNTCQSDPITFTNLSTGANITDYLWDFGDTNSSIETDPTHTYESAGEYTVSLAVTNSVGCITNYEENITVHSLPTTDFSVELGCTDRNTQLTDLTTVDNANISSWDWDFGDPDSGSNNISAEENPVHSFSETGDFDVVLSTTTDFGCETSIEKVITVYESPTADFEFDAGCLENAFLFTDQSIPNNGGSIISRTWDIDGSIYTVPNPSHTFSTAGSYLATLTIRSDNLCTISVSRTVVVNELPIAGFSLDSYCANTESTLADASILENDEIVDWQWTINGQSEGNTATIVYTFDDIATYQVDLQIITARGCIVSTSKNIDIFELPTADFESSTEYSAPPAKIIFNNLSNNAVVYQWNFGDGSDINSNGSPTHVFTDLGIYDVTLTTQSAEGCFAMVTKQIHVVNPVIDLSIDEITIFDEGKRLLLTISNHGTIPVGGINATVSLNNELSINEALDLIILPNETAIPKTLSFTLPENGNIDFICIDLSTSDGADVNRADNTQCINITDDFKILVPYPSPVSKDGLLTIPIIGEKNDEVTIALLDTSGKQHVSESVQLYQRGLNNISLLLTRLKPGIYFIQVQSPKTIKSFRIFVN